MSKDSVFSEVSEVEQEYWSSPENRYYQLRELITQLDFKAIREDRLAEATKRAQEKGMSEGLAQGMAQGMAQGEAKGKAEGKAEGIASTARRMLALNFTLEQISQATGLSLDEVESLRSN